MKKNILIVDDYKNTRFIIKSVLQTIKNINFYEAENGLQALDICQNKKIDLILLDIEMPVMNGIQFLETFYENKKIGNIKIPIVIISGSLSDDIINQTRGKGVVNYIEKPFKASIFIETIKKYL